MSHTIATLICNPAAPLLDNELAGAIACALGDKGFGGSGHTVLSPGIADDFTFHGAVDPVALDAAIRAFVGDRPIDIVLQRSQNRRKRLLIADMDSTIIEQECIDELADFAGKRAEISAITERAMRGELDFEAALKERVAMLAGLCVSVLEDAFATRITLTPGARTLVQTMSASGAACALVSGGFTFFAEKIAAGCGFDVAQANQLIIEKEALTGAVRAPVLGREAKRAALLGLIEERGLDPAATLAVGDGANDLSMLGAAGLGVAFRAKPAVAAAADASIIHGDLTALLYLQGYRQDEFVSA